MIIDVVCLLGPRLTLTNEEDSSKADENAKQFDWDNLLTINDEAKNANKEGIYLRYDADDS